MREIFNGADSEAQLSGETMSNEMSNNGVVISESTDRKSVV